MASLQNSGKFLEISFFLENLGEKEYSVYSDDNCFEYLIMNNKNL